MRADLPFLFKAHTHTPPSAQAMRSMLYSGETEVVGALHPTLLVLLPVVDGPTAEQKHAAEVFTILLSSLDIEPKTTMRKVSVMQWCVCVV